MMMKKMKLPLYLIVCLFLCLAVLAASQSRPTLCVSRNSTFQLFSQPRRGTSQRVAASEEVRNIIYTYSTILKGFATRLIENETELLRRLPAVLSELPKTVFQLQTTRKPLLLGLNPATGILLDSKEGDGIIIGVPNTSVWPESRCYNDARLGAIPAKWKARYEAVVPVKSRSPRDDNDHSKNTSSMAGGMRVPGTSFFSYATGTATGMAARARTAAYKVCWASGCHGSDILSAMEKAVNDGVDVLSLSLGGQPKDFTCNFNESILVISYLCTIYNI
ncbi:subtilisin-like protease SBT1.7 [Nymphaea colorata]|nr:subtilisin-like protease SBT1.7 [Nymphaea colorata]